MMLALQVQNQYNGATSDAAYRLAQQVAAKTYSGSEWSASEVSSPSNGPSPQEAEQPTQSTDLQLTVINFLAGIDVAAPGSLRLSGAVNHRNEAKQTLLHIATTLGFHRLVRRLVVVGAQLDLQDVNGYTALGLASLMGQAACVRVLIEAGASYDRPTLFGEMPLDLAKIGEHTDVESLLLSAVWSTNSGLTKRGSPTATSATVGPLLPPVSVAPTPGRLGSVSAASVEADSEIDDDNPSDSDEETDHVPRVHRRSSRSRKVRGKRRSSGQSPPVPVRRPSASSPPVDDPPAYDTLSRTGGSPTQARSPRSPWSISNLFHDKAQDSGGWVAFPAPSWDTLSKMTSPDEVKLFTQAMAAAAFNAVVQSGATTNDNMFASPDGKKKAKRNTRSRERERELGVDREREREGETTDLGASPGSVSSTNSAAQRQLVKVKSKSALGYQGKRMKANIQVIECCTSSGCPFCSLWGFGSSSRPCLSLQGCHSSTPNKLGALSSRGCNDGFVLTHLSLYFSMIGHERIFFDVAGLA